MSTQKRKPKHKKLKHRVMIYLLIGIVFGGMFFFMFSQPPNINNHWRSRMFLMMYELMSPIGWGLLIFLWFMGIWLYDEIVNWHFQDFLDEADEELNQR